MRAGRPFYELLDEPATTATSSFESTSCKSGGGPRLMAGPSEPEALACARITRCATIIRRVSVISTTSTRKSATVCQCRRRDVDVRRRDAHGARVGLEVPAP